MSSLPKHYRDLLFMCPDSFNSQVTRGQPLTFSQPAHRGVVEKRPRNTPPRHSQRKRIAVPFQKAIVAPPKEFISIWCFAR